MGLGRLHVMHARGGDLKAAKLVMDFTSELVYGSVLRLRPGPTGRD